MLRYGQAAPYPNTGELGTKADGILGGTSGLRPDTVLGALDRELRHLALDDPRIGAEPPGWKDLFGVEHVSERLLVQIP